MKTLFGVIVSFVAAIGFTMTSMAAEEVIEIEEMVNDEIAADAIEDYQVEGSLFQQITDLEQEKVLMQLEKERAQLDLDLDRLAAEKIKLHMEIDALSGRADVQQQELETQMAKLEAEAARLEKEKEKLESQEEEKTSSVKSSSSSVASSAKEEKEENPISKKYKLVNVIGAGSQLQATIADLTTGQNKRISAGRVLDGYVVKSISLDEGVVLVKGSDTQRLNVSNNSK